MGSLDCDVAVVGGGPAGATAALTLSRLGLQVALVESSRYEAPRVGETLPPAARPVLARLGLVNAVATLGSTPSYGNQSAWGGPEVWSTSFIFGPHGNGWHLDRQRFDRLLVDTAAAAGARLIEGIRVTACIPQSDDSWRLDFDHGPDQLTANAVIDATGRSAALARRLGGRRQPLDHLVGVGVRYRGPTHDAGCTLVEATRDGWWYSAPIPPDQTMVMFMTDADLCRSGRLTDPEVWLGRLAATRATALRVADHEQLSGPAVSSAVSHRLARGGYDKRWLATGDAAVGVDPLSSSGLERALLTGEAAGYAIAHWLLGRVEAAQDYERWLDVQFAKYRRERFAYYALETRWSEAPFWRRRQADSLSPSRPPERPRIGSDQALRERIPVDHAGPAGPTGS